MAQVTLTYPDDLAEAIGADPADQARSLRLMAALKLFEVGRLSFRRAAELAGLSYDEFMDACARYQVSIYNDADDELDRELDADAATLDKALGA
jgi:predicted HTH domain antitoxin